MKYLFTIELLVVLLMSNLYTNYTLFSYVLLAVTILELLRKIGKGIALREMIAVYSCIIYLLMPILGYQVYNFNNALSRLWIKYMPVSENVYFSFVFPAVTLFILGMSLPSLSSRHEPDDKEGLAPILKKAKDFLKVNKPWIPLLVFGFLGYVLKNINTVSALSFFFDTFYLLLFAALLTIYFSPGLKYKKLLIGLIILPIAYEAIQTGMFTIIVYMGVVIGSIIFIGARIPFWRKILMTALAILFIVTLQSTKGAFRKQTWGGTYEGSKTGLFANLVAENITNFDAIFDKKAFFPLYARMNQGFNTALVMRRIPAVQDFDNGRSIYLTVASALVPRVIWEDKLQSGGAYNMKYFAGWTLRGWSANIGPVGEAYGNFGVWGGIIYMFIFGLFIRFVYFTVLKLSNKFPLLIFWIPVLFFELSYCMEGDTLQALNSVIKVAIFTYIVYLVQPRLLGVSRATGDSSKPAGHVPGMVHQ